MVGVNERDESMEVKDLTSQNSYSTGHASCSLLAYPSEVALPYDFDRLLKGVESPSHYIFLPFRHDI